MIRNLLREPLVHFIAFGLVVFALSALFAPDDERVISLSADEQQRLSALWEGEAGRAPNEAELKAALDAHIQEEALYREARQLGLGEGDTIIRRRLAQKMRFTLEDREDVGEPSDDALEEYFSANKARFGTAPALTFDHVFVSPESDKGQVEARAGQWLKQLRGGSVSEGAISGGQVAGDQAGGGQVAGGQPSGKRSQDGENWRAMGDPFILQRSYGRISQEALARLFGQSFAKQLFVQADAGKKGSWIGPIPSSYGLHLVRIVNANDGQTPELDSVRPQVVAAWKEDAQRRANQRAVEQLVERYSIELEQP